MVARSFSNEVMEKIHEEVDWIKLLPEDPRKHLIESGESFTIYRTLIDLFDLPSDHPDVINAHKKVLEAPLIQNFIKNLSNWEKDIVTGHNKPTYLPNQLWLLLDWGINAESNAKFESAINSLMVHQDKQTGQFLAYSKGYGRQSKDKNPQWTSVLCDHNLITSILLLAGFKNEERVKRGLKRMGELITETSQGFGWKCVPGLKTKFRGPGRVNDVCPMAVVDALRGYWILPKEEWPNHLIESGKTLLNCWIKRATEKPYIFGHGKRFRLPRAPFIWYNIGTVLDATRHYPELIKTQAFQELIAVSLLEFPPDGRFVPKSVFLYYKNYSFGQKKEVSPWMTFFLSRIYKNAVDADPAIIKAVKKIDAKSLKGSKGGPKSKKK